MKKLHRIVLAFVTFFVLSGIGVAQELNTAQLYKEGVEAYENGDYQTAATKLKVVVQHHPREPKPRYYLRNALLKLRDGTVKKNTIEGDLQKMIIESVEFEEATLDTVFKYLAAKTKELSGGKTVANFIYKGEDETRHKPQITLKLSNVPVSEVIRYVGDLSRTQFRYEPYAIVGIPKSNLAENQKKEEDPLADFKKGPAKKSDNVFD